MTASHIGIVVTIFIFLLGGLLTIVGYFYKASTSSVTNTLKGLTDAVNNLTLETARMHGDMELVRNLIKTNSNDIKSMKKDIVTLREKYHGITQLPEEMMIDLIRLPSRMDKVEHQLELQG